MAYGLSFNVSSPIGTSGYAAHGLAPAGFDEGTIAPTAAGAAIPFKPEYSTPSLSYFYSHFRTHIWTPYGFRDAFNLGEQWYDPDELGIDQGPIVIMIENYRTQRPWRLFMQNPEVQTGLQRAGFVSLPFVNLTAEVQPRQGAANLSWAAQPGRSYQVEYSPDLLAWFSALGGTVVASGQTAGWTDVGASNVAVRFYRVFIWALLSPDSIRNSWNFGPPGQPCRSGSISARMVFLLAKRR